MLLVELKKGQKGVITKIDANMELKRRFHSMGIVVGETITLKECSIGCKTLEIEVANTLIALREDEAKKIEIKPL